MEPASIPLLSWQPLVCSSSRDTPKVRCSKGARWGKPLCKLPSQPRCVQWRLGSTSLSSPAFPCSTCTLHRLLHPCPACPIHASETLPSLRPLPSGCPGPSQRCSGIAQTVGGGSGRFPPQLMRFSRAVRVPHPSPTPAQGPLGPPGDARTRTQSRASPSAMQQSPARSQLRCWEARTWELGTPQPHSWPGPLPTAGTFCLAPSQEQLGLGFQATQQETASAPKEEAVPEPASTCARGWVFVFFGAN